MTQETTNSIEAFLAASQSLLASLNITQKQDTLNELLQTAQSLLLDNPDRRRELGPVLSELKKLSQAIEAYQFDWLPIEGGYLAVGHRPKIKMLNVMPMLGVTHVLTLQSVSEKAKTIGQQVTQADMTWCWFPMESAKPPSPEKTQELLSLFDDLKIALSQGARIYVHCAAGIHRTGMISYALLRYLGISETDAMHGLAQMRQETAQCVGEERLNWVNEMLG